MSLPSTTTEASPAPTTDISAGNLHRLSSCKRLTLWASAFAIFMGILVLLGWTLDIRFFKSVVTGLPVMVPNTALCLVLSGVALGCLANAHKSARFQRLGQTCAFLSSGIALLTLGEYLFRRNFGLDLLLLCSASASAFAGNAFPGRPSPQTALTLCLLGGALFALFRTVTPSARFAQLLALAASLVSLTALMGYLTNVLFFYGVSTYTGMALHTILVCLALAVGVLCVHPDRAFMGVITSESVGGSTARRLLPAVVLVPFLLNWLRYVGERRSLVDTGTSTSLMVVATIVLLFGLLLASSDRLHSLDLRRQEAMNAVQQANAVLEVRVAERTAELAQANGILYKEQERLRVTLSSIGDAVIATDALGNITFMNPVAEAMTKWQQEEALGRDLKEVFVIFSEETRQAVESPVEKVLREGGIVGLANHTLLRDRNGLEKSIDDTSAPIRDATGHLLGVILVFHDITAQQRTEREIHAPNTRLQRTMTETHHRVKNNLQVIAALAEMQAEEGSVIPASALERVGQHARSLAAIHDLLTQQSKETSHGAEGVRAEELLRRLMPLLQVTAGGRAVRARSETFWLPTRHAAAVSVLINELVSNALKHTAGRVEVALTLTEQRHADQERRHFPRALLSVCDEGPGFPASFDPVHAANTGLELVQMLARHDLQGEVRFANREEGGACVSVIFSLKLDT